MSMLNIENIKTANTSLPFDNKVFEFICDMSRRNQRDERDIASTVAVVAIGTATVYAGYKLFGSLFGSNKPQQNRPNPDEGKPPQSLPFRINSPHRFPEQSKIYVVNTTEECKYAMKELKSHCEEFGVLGFDCEWVSQQGVGRSPVALIQLASHRGLCVLVRLSELGHIPKELKNILMDGSILKVGVATNIDLKIFISYLSETYLGVALDKNPNLRCCDWEDETLTNAEITYAATDAMVAVEIFKVFATKYEPNGTYQNRMQKTIDACLEKLEMDDSYQSQFQSPNSYACCSGH